MKLLLDSSFPTRFGRAFGTLVPPPHEVWHFFDKFIPETPDADWINELESEKDWILLTIAPPKGRFPQQLLIWKSVSFTVFLLESRWCSASAWQQAAGLSRLIPKVLSRVEAGLGNEIVSVSLAGHFRKLDSSNSKLS